MNGRSADSGERVFIFNVKRLFTWLKMHKATAAMQSFTPNLSLWQLVNCQESLVFTKNCEALLNCFFASSAYQTKVVANVDPHILHHAPTRIRNQKHIQMQRFFCMKAATFQNRWRCGRIALKSSASDFRTALLNSVQIVSCHRSWMALCPERKLDKQKLGEICMTHF